MTSAPTDSALVVFTTPGCPYCKRAKEALREGNYTFAEVDVSVDKQLRATLNDATGRRTVPQIYVGGTYVGGSDDLLSKLQDGSFAALMQGGAAPGGLPPQLEAATKQALAEAAQQASKSSTAGAHGAPLAPELKPVADALADPSTGILATAPAAAGAAKTFSGAQLLSWLQQRGGSSSQSGGQSIDKSEAEALGGKLLASNVVTLVAGTQPARRDVEAVRPEGSYRLMADAPRSVAWGQPLNTHYWWGPSPARPAEVVAEDLRSQILGLYDAHLSKDGRSVSYGGMRKDPAFWRYVDTTAELQRVDLSPLSREALTAFAINTYNALIIHTLVVHGTERYKSAAGRLSFFSKAARDNIGGYEYTADDLENGILRGNRPPASSIGMLLGLPGLSMGPFGRGDPRADKVVDPVDPRIHFALVCGAKSCPPIKLYSADNLDEGLGGAAEAFCSGEVEVDTSARAVTLSKIFKWYYPDFGSTKAERLRFLLPYLPADKRAALEGLLAGDPGAGRITVNYREYSWDLNGEE